MTLTWQYYPTSSTISRRPTGSQRAHLEPLCRDKQHSEHHLESRTSASPRRRYFDQQMIDIDIRTADSASHLGIYTLRDELLLAQPPPHPTDVPIPSNNPLDTSPGSVILAPSLSIISPVARQQPAFSNGTDQDDQHHSALLSPGADRPISQDEARDGIIKIHGETPVKGSKDLKRRKPKTGIIKSSSSFVSRVLVSDGLSKRLADRDPRGSFAIVNIGRALQWLDLSSSNKVTCEA